DELRFLGFPSGPVTETRRTVKRFTAFRSRVLYLRQAVPSRGCSHSMERTMLTTMLVALGALLLAVVGCAVLDPGPPAGGRETDHRDTSIGDKDPLPAF
ncbi:MAG TPA: hypothetical protein VGI78_13205, partial [Acetobacteraceae bacterium]